MGVRSNTVISTRAGVTALAVGAICVGALLRIFLYLGPRALWGDEAMLALSVVERSPA
jgi:hypothetical protein